MRKLYHLCLEKYPSRYTWQLADWNKAVFDRRNINYEVLEGETLPSINKIVTGSVLDAHGRSYYSMTQISKLVELMQQGMVTNEDVVFIEDMFAPGIESIPYIMNQTNPAYHPKIFVRCWAQSPDPDDFINRTGMLEWMRHYELMLDQFLSGILIASEELAAYMRVSGIKAPLYVVGLPFGKEEVQSRVPDRKPVWDRKERIAFASRWDDEKQPDFYMDLAEEFYKIDSRVEFAVFTGRDYLDSNREEYASRAMKLERAHNVNFKVYTGLEKNEYYRLLADSKIIFNCALQDWVSFTAIEADAMGTWPLYPAYRSFPETLFNNANHMYTPWSIDDAVAKLGKMLMAIDARDTSGSVSGEVVNYHDRTIDRTLDVFEGNGEVWGRNDLNYRLHVNTDKRLI